MTSTQTECNLPSYEFGRLSQRKIMADFSGGDLTSDGGLLLMREIDNLYRISERLAACFTDHRDASRVQHELKTLIGQRLYALVQGYEDVNDHDELRHDRLFGVVLEAVQDSPSQESWLNEPPLPDYVEPRRLRSRPYPFLVRTGLQMSQLCWGAIAICVLVYGLLAAVAGGSEPGAIAIAFGEFAIRFCSHFLIGTVAFWGFTALWESSR